MHFEVIYVSPGKRIKIIRKSLFMTQFSFGEICKIADPTIRRYELEKLNPKQSTLQKIANATNMSLSFFTATTPFENLDFLDQYKGVILHSLSRNGLFEMEGRSINDVGQYEFWKAISDNILSITTGAGNELSIQYIHTRQMPIDRIKVSTGRLELDFNDVLPPLIDRGCAANTYFVLQRMNAITNDGHIKLLRYADEMAHDPDFQFVQKNPPADPEDK